MAMGWIGGVIAANHLCSQNSSQQSNPKWIDNHIKDWVRNIEHMMYKEGCKTLQEKRQFLKKLECFKFDFGKEKNKYYEVAFKHLTQQIEFELQKEYERKYVKHFKFSGICPILIM